MKIKALEIHVTPNCVMVHGEEKAISIALEKIRAELAQCRKGCPTDTFAIELYRLIK